ncbi:MAG: magnesium/cobalt transporter CorA [Candidatus Heimdallarchaeota archaeon]|nr:MAG: magnesium and cobalt transport protein CorA [Candidatus Gerdarchaeota archaeon]RLI70850.1 MAG: magnesium and cobalt transport protein CorA [Candidatus Heimdallarchaeota archaeon]
MIKRILSFNKEDSKLHGLDVQKALEENLGTLWIDYIEPTVDELNTLQQLFNFHSLTIEDCLEANQRPKLEEYPDYLFFILVGVRKLLDVDEIEPYQIAFYLGKNFVITIREKRGGLSLKSVHNKILLKNTRILTHEVDFLAYVIVDTFIDGYLDLLEEIEDTIEEIEEIVVHRPERELLDKTFDLRTNILIVLKAIRPQRVVIRELAVDEMPLISKPAQTYFNDVYDHILEANDLCSSYRDRVSSIVDIYLSSASNKMNDTMKLIAVLTAVITIPNLIASFGGINFTEFATHGIDLLKDWPFWTFLGTIIFTTIMIVIIFKRMKI